MVELQRGLLFFQRVGTANCCWKGYCRQQGGGFELPGHPETTWEHAFWTALNVHVLNEAGRYRLLAVETKLLDLGPMDPERPESGLPTWTEREALAMLPRDALVLDFAHDEARMRFLDGLPSEAWVDEEWTELKPYAPEPIPPDEVPRILGCFRVEKTATATDLFFVNAPTPEEAVRLAENPDETVWTNQQPTRVERLAHFPPGVLVCPQNMVTDAEGQPRPSPAAGGSGLDRRR